MGTKDRQVYNNTELLNGFRKGDEQAFGAVYRLFYPSLCYFAAKFTGDTATGEDIASDSFLKVWEKRSLFYELPVLKVYLYRAVRNSSISHQQKKNSERNKHDGFRNACEHEPTVIELIVQAELMRELEMGMNQLPPQRRRIFRLLFKEGKSVRVVAGELQLSIHTVNEHRKLGMRFLRKLMASARIFCL